MDLTNKIFLFGGFYPETIKDVVKGIVEKFDIGIREITIYINSDGGEIESLFAVTDTIDTYAKKGLTVTTIAVGAAQSAGFYLLTYGNKRYAGKNTTIMVHGAQGGLRGDEEAFKRYVAEMVKINDKFANIIKSKTGMSEDDARKLLKRNNYFTAKEAVKYGLIDGIWDIDNEVSELSKYIQDNIAASAKPSAEITDVMKFVASIKNLNNEENIMENSEFTLKLQAVQGVADEYKSQAMSLTARVTELEKEVAKSESYKTEFYAKQKEKIIASGKKIISKDPVKQTEFETKVRKFIALDYDAFEELVNEFTAAGATIVPTGLVLDSTEVDKKRAEADKEKAKLSAEAKAIAEYHERNSVKIDTTYADQCAGIKGGN